jgi:hypothetical protein
MNSTVWVLTSSKGTPAHANWIIQNNKKSCPKNKENFSCHEKKSFPLLNLYYFGIQDYMLFKYFIGLFSLYEDEVINITETYTQV